MERVIAYVDGFNLYFGLRSKGWKRYYWLNVQALAQNLLKRGQALVVTKYFTARIAGPPDKQERQSAYIEALETLREYRGASGLADFGAELVVTSLAFDPRQGEVANSLRKLFVALTAARGIGERMTYK
jgi:hypothetical protein